MATEFKRPGSPIRTVETSKKVCRTCTDNSSVAKCKITVKGISKDLTNHQLASIAAKEMMFKGPDGKQVSYDLTRWMVRFPLKLKEPEQSFRDKARAGLANLNKLYYDHATQQWQFPEKALLKQYEFKIMDGFCKGMYNSMGRMGVEALLQHLFCENSEVLIVRNIGGCGSKKDPCSRVVQFVLSLENLFDERSPSESSPSSTESFDIRPTEEETDFQPIAKRLKCKRSSPPGEKGINKFDKRFSPDVILTRRLSISSLDFEELLAVKVKSGILFSMEYEAQLFYEMLPMLSQEKEALGLLICASQAHIYRYTVMDEKDVRLESKSYSFTPPTQSNHSLTDAVVDMCCDLHSLLAHKL